MEKNLGRWAFILGLLISIIVGFQPFTYASLILVILGLIVGFLNIADKEATKYLIAIIALIVIGVAGLSSFDVLGSVYAWVQTVLTSFVTFVAASGVVVAIKVLFETGKND
ncbi:MAG: hypothetical protein HW405_992 [Candidatus Berkelbacteria bacterium]|nr:hypothetical protein [Candidatus Berkelbacteria bacterium]